MNTTAYNIDPHIRSVFQAGRYTWDDMLILMVLFDTAYDFVISGQNLTYQGISKPNFDRVASKYKNSSILILHTMHGTPKAIGYGTKWYNEGMHPTEYLSGIVRDNDTFYTIDGKIENTGMSSFEFSLGFISRRGRSKIIAKTIFSGPFQDDNLQRIALYVRKGRKLNRIQ